MRRMLVVSLLLIVALLAPARTGISIAPAGPAGAIIGKVFDSNGRPLRNSVVGLLRVIQKRGARAVDVVAAQSTNVLGEFRINHVPPGEYYVGAAPPFTKTQATTLYPSAANLDSASKVVVRGDEEIEGVDIRVRAVP
jgi:hypothetical protein